MNKPISRPSLLPPNATKAELALEAVLARVNDIPTSFRDLWNPQKCPIKLLPWLAWAVSVDAWDSDWPEHTKRAAVASSIDVHRHKGTAGSMDDVVAAFGGRVVITEWWQMTPPGKEHTFVLNLAASGGEGKGAQYVDDIIQAVWRTKPVRSHFIFIQSASMNGQIGVAPVLRPLAFARLVLQADAEVHG